MNYNVFSYKYSTENDNDHYDDVCDGVDGDGSDDNDDDQGNAELCEKGDIWWQWRWNWTIA